MNAIIAALLVVSSACASACDKYSSREEREAWDMLMLTLKSNCKRGDVQACGAYLGLVSDARERQQKQKQKGKP